MKLVNGQVYKFMNIVSQKPDKLLKAKDSFAIVLTKNSLMNIYSAIEVARKELLKKVDDVRNKEYKNEEEKNKKASEAEAKANAEFIDLLDQEVEANPTKLSISSLESFSLSLIDAEFLLRLPFIEEYIGELNE